MRCHWQRGCGRSRPSSAGTLVPAANRTYGGYATVVIGRILVVDEPGDGLPPTRNQEDVMVNGWQDDGWVGDDVDDDVSGLCHSSRMGTPYRDHPGYPDGRDDAHAWLDREHTNGALVEEATYATKMQESAWGTDEHDRASYWLGWVDVLAEERDRRLRRACQERGH